MGIKGLSQMVRGSMVPCNISEFSGSTAAIDASHWLHKDAQTQASNIVAEGAPGNVKCIMRLIRVLLRNKMKPIIVLDGRQLPAKEESYRNRKEERNKFRDFAFQFYEEGKKDEADKYFRRCVSKTRSMVLDLVKTLRRQRIDYVFAPYEADAQCAYLARNGFADYVLTDDSDLIVYGCPRIIFEMDGRGNGKLFLQEWLPDCLNIPRESFSFDLFRWMCILLGCDYLRKLRGVRLANAKRVIYGKPHSDIKEMLQSIPEVLRHCSKVPSITDQYTEGFIQADHIFLYHLVYDTRLRKVAPLNPYRDGISPDDVPYCGVYKSNKEMTQFAIGNTVFDTFNIIEDFADPVLVGYGPSSIWSTGQNAPLVKVRDKGKGESSASKEVEYGWTKVESKKRRGRHRK